MITRRLELLAKSEHFGDAVIVRTVNEYDFDNATLCDQLEFVFDEFVEGLDFSDGGRYLLTIGYYAEVAENNELRINFEIEAIEESLERFISSLNLVRGR